MKTLTIDAPAKLNLFLKVLRKRPDHYHDIFSLFHKIDLSDKLTFRSNNSSECRIISKIPKFPKGSKNLIVKAFRLLKEKTHFEGGISVRITKNIPIAGGLGGGSSDGAATLIAVNQLFKLKLSLKQLQKLSLSLGADLPFFLNPAGSALVSSAISCITSLLFRGRS